jgi:hypothetical protein
MFGCDATKQFMSSTFFDCLTTLQQAQLLSSQGYYLHTRHEPTFIVDMYQLQGLHIEIYYDKCDEGFVVIRNIYPTADQVQKSLNTDVSYRLRTSNRSHRYYTC